MAFQPMSYTPQQYGGTIDPYLGESEDERRRRLAAEAAAGGPAAGALPVAPVAPVKQTITYDPETGEQRMKIEGSVQDLSAANPLTPTLSMPSAEPVVGGAMPAPQIQAQPIAPMAPMTPEPQTTVDEFGQVAPATATAPAERSMLPPGVEMGPDGKLRMAGQQPQAVAPMPAVGTVPTPGPGVQVAGPAQMPPAAVAPVAAPAPSPYSLATGQQPGLRAPAPMAPPMPAAAPAQDRFQAIQDNPAELINYSKDAAVPKYLQDRARETAYEQLSSQRQEEKAVEAAKQLIASGDNNKIANALQGRGAKGEEGSYLKMIMLGFISPELAGAEAIKLGLAKSKWETSTITDDKGQQIGVEVQRRADGKLLGGTRMDGKPLSSAELEKVAGSTKDYDVVGGTFISDTLKDKSGVPLVGSVYRSKTNPTDQFVQTSEGRKSLTGFRPQSSGGSREQQLELAQNRLDMETIAKFGQQTASERIRAFENTNKLRADRGLPLLSLAEMGLNPDGSVVGEAIRRPGTTMAPAAVAPVPAPAAVAPAAPAVAAPVPAPAVSPAAAPMAVAQPSISAPGPVSIPVPAAGGKIPTASTMQEQTKEADFNRAIREAAAKARINVGQNLEEQKNKIRMTMPSSEQNANRVLATLNDIATHPGLDKTVGLPRLLATPLESIPGSDQRAFAQKFKQLGGQEFLAAYDQLRGSGGISETEGAKAEQAISALKDTGISPQEFKKNMWIFRDAVQTGLDKQRELIGLPPKYSESPRREEAKAWLRLNPNLPESEAVRKMLVGF